MTRRALPAWLSGIVLIVTALSVGAFVVKIRPCSLCDGLSQRVSERMDCPNCADSGKVSWYRSRLQPKVSLSFARLLANYRPDAAPNFVQELRQFIGDDEKDPFNFFRAPDARSRHAALRFVRSEGKDYLVVLLSCAGISMKDYSLAEALLLSPDGKALDGLGVWCETVGVDLHLEIPDGSGLRIRPADRDSAALRAPRFEYTLSQRNEREHRGVFVLAEHGNPDDFCRFKIADDRFQALK